MNHTKIIELSNKCNSNAQKIIELYALVGGNNFQESVNDIIYKRIKELEHEKINIEEQIKKYLQ